MAMTEASYIGAVTYLTVAFSSGLAAETKGLSKPDAINWPPWYKNTRSGLPAAEKP
jgi:hypothetical protein